MPYSKHVLPFWCGQHVAYSIWYRSDGTHPYLPEEIERSGVVPRHLGLGIGLGLGCNPPPPRVIGLGLGLGLEFSPPPPTGQGADHEVRPGW